MNILTMAGYGIYIWPAYGLTFFVFAFNFLTAWREHKKIKIFLKQYFRKNACTPHTKSN